MNYCLPGLLTLLIIFALIGFSMTMHFHHSNYKVHHRMGKMKIKVKPEGAKLVFTGGDLDVDLHPAHGFVRPIHNVIVTHARHDEHHEEPVQHHEIEHEEEEEHSGHHEWHHSYHHDEHGGHDDEGYGFRHFNHWPNSLHGEESFMGNDFYHGDHHGDHHGHFRDEIGDVAEREAGTEYASNINSFPDRDGEKNGMSRHEISQANEQGDSKEEDEEDRDKAYYRSFEDKRTDAIIYGKKIFPDDVAAPTHKSNVEEKFEKVSSRITPRLRTEKEDTDDGSARGTISPFDDENDSQKEGALEDQKYERMEGKTRNIGSDTAKINVKELQRIANKIQPDIPNEDEIPIKETARNTKDFGSPSQVYVNMSGEPHNYGDEEKSEDFPTRNRDFRPDVADNDNERHLGDYYPNEEEQWGQPHDDNEEEDTSYKKSLNEFRLKAARIARISNEEAKKKDESPPVIVHPDGDPRSRELKKAFYEFNPRPTAAQHMATISDFNVRSQIAKRKQSNYYRRIRRLLRKRRSLMIDRFIKRLEQNW